MESFGFYHLGVVRPAVMNTDALLPLPAELRAVGFVIQGETPYSFLLLMDESSLPESAFLELGNILAAQALKRIHDALTISPPHELPASRVQLMLQAGRIIERRSFHLVTDSTEIPLQTVLLAPARETLAHA